MTEPTQPDTPAAAEDAAQPADVEADDTIEAEPSEADVPVLLHMAVAGVGDKDEAVLLPADQAQAMHDAGHATYLDNAAAHALGLEGVQLPRVGGPAEPELELDAPAEPVGSDADQATGEDAPPAFMYGPADMAVAHSEQPGPRATRDELVAYGQGIGAEFADDATKDAIRDAIDRRVAEVTAQAETPAEDPQA